MEYDRAKADINLRKIYRIMKGIGKKDRNMDKGWSCIKMGQDMKELFKMVQNMVRD